MPAPSTYGGIFDYDAKAERLRTVNASLEDPAVWNDPKKAQELGKEKKTLETVVETIDHLKSNLDDNTELYEMSKADEDMDALVAIEADAAKLAEEGATVVIAARGRELCRFLSDRAGRRHPCGHRGGRRPGDPGGGERGRRPGRPRRPARRRR